MSNKWHLRGIREPRLYETEGFVHLPATLPGRVARETGERLATASEIEELTDLSRKAAAARDLSNRSTRDAAREAFHAQRDTVTKLIAEGRGAEVLAADQWDLSDFEEQNRVIHDGAHAELNRLYRLARPISLRIAERLAKAALKLHDKLEEQEKAEAADWQVPYQPSMKLKTLGQLSWRTEQYCPPEYCDGTDPASMLKCLAKMK